MRTLLDRFNAALMALMYLTILIQIIARVVLEIPTTWSTEFGVILFTFIVLFGTPGVTRERAHLKVDALYNLFPRRLKLVLDIVFALLYIAFFFFMAAGAYGNAAENWMMDIPTIEWCHLGWIYLMVFLATVLIILAYLETIREDVRELFRRGG